MSETKQSAPHTAAHDVIGLTLVAAGAVVGASAFQYLRKGPVEDASAFTAIMTAFAEAIGSPAMFWLCLGFVFVGARMFLFGAERGLVRDAIGFAATSLGLSILCGALSPTLGGSFGRAIGGEATELGSRVLGVFLGLAALVIPAWVIWLRVAPPALVARANALVGGAPEPATADQEMAPRSARPATSPKEPTEDPSGVTSAEARALLPDPEREEILAALRTANRHGASSANHAPSPYPPDVRREGGIPSGARPIEPAHELRVPPPAAPRAAPAPIPAPARPAPAPSGAGAGGAGPVRAWSPAKPGTGPVGAPGDLARAEDARGPVAAAGAPRTAAELKSAPPNVAPAPTAGARPATGVTALPIPSSRGPLESPTWEREIEEAELPEEPVAVRAPEPTDEEPPALGDAEVVDAYGTPLELVAALRGQEEAPSDEQIFEEELASELAADLAGDELADTESEGEEDADDDGVWAADEPFAGDEEDELPEPEPQVERPRAKTAAAEKAPASQESSAAALPVGEAHPTSAPTKAAEAVEEEEREVVLQPVQPSLFDGPKPAPAPSVERAPARAPRPARERRAAPAPQAAAQAENVEDTEAAAAPASDDLVYRCGLLFLQNQRVAVSMLQREFGLDFKQATAILDQLQDQGLIGPYLGGQRRDILLTAEEWRAKSGAAS